jgi:hypothetical protein
MIFQFLNPLTLVKGLIRSKMKLLKVELWFSIIACIIVVVATNYINFKRNNETVLSIGTLIASYIVGQVYVNERR